MRKSLRNATKHRKGDEAKVDAVSLLIKSVYYGTIAEFLLN
jgi:hypothetical protein